jgi:hypothetical protein
MAYAQILVNGTRYEVSPNHAGAFDRISNVQPLATIPIEVTYPAGKVGQSVLIEVLDGGVLDNGKQVEIVRVDFTRRLSFHFQVPY